MDHVEPGLPPKARIHGRRGDLIFEEGLWIQVPDRAALLIHDDRILELGDEAPVRELKIEIVGPVELGVIEQVLLRSLREPGGILSLRHY